VAGDVCFLLLTDEKQQQERRRCRHGSQSLTREAEATTAAMIRMLHLRRVASRRPALPSLPLWLSLEITGWWWIGGDGNQIGSGDPEGCASVCIYRQRPCSSCYNPYFSACSSRNSVFPLTTNQSIVFFRPNGTRAVDYSVRLA